VKPLKIAFLTLEKREHDRDYARPQPEFGTAPAALLRGFAGLPEVEIHVISCVQQPVKSPEKIAPNIFYHSLVVPKIGWMRTFFQGCIRATRKKLAEIQPDIVHGQGTERDCALAAVFSGFPNILTLHGNMRAVARANQVPPFSYNWLAARLEGFVLPRTQGVVCITSYTKRSVEALARRTWIVPNAVDPSFFDVQPAPDLSATPTGLCVGTVVRHKNQNDFIRALDPLAQEKNFRMHFASEPSKDAYGAEFYQMVRERSWCEHIGYLNREQLKARLVSAAFLALPTREDNCPMVVLEAMAAGVPVLASAIGGVPDLIEHEVTGLLCDPDQPETFRVAVARLLDDRPFALRLAATAKVRARARFHPLVIAQKHLEIYREVVQQKAEH
jgi:glycosyltransferase involved in cell wall biosynthesis